MFRIRQATKKGYIEVESGGVVDLSFPGSNTRRGRVQENGDICPTLTCASENALYRLEELDEDKDMIKILELMNEDKCIKVENTETGKKYRISIRKLIPEECFELMGMASSDVQKCKAMGLSDSALYKIAGNGLISNICQFILEHLYKTLEDSTYETTDERLAKQYGCNI